MRQAILSLSLIIIAAKLGGEVLGRLGQPPVLGELLMGVLLGNLSLFGITALEPLRDSYHAARGGRDRSHSAVV